MFSLLLSPPGNRARKKNVIRSLAGAGAARAPWHRAACSSTAVSEGQRPPLRAHIPPLTLTSPAQHSAPASRIALCHPRGRHCPCGGLAAPSPPALSTQGSVPARSRFVSQCPSQTDQNCIFTEAIKIPGIHRPYDLLNMFPVAKPPADEKIAAAGYCCARGERPGGSRWVIENGQSRDARRSRSQLAAALQRKKHLALPKALGNELPPSRPTPARGNVLG